MSYQDKLVIEINAYLDRLMEREQPLQASWIAHRICSDHELGLAANEDRDFWRHGGYTTTREAVRKCINKRAGDEVERDASQYLLPGFDHLHSYYMVSREGSDIGVWIYDMSEDEIEAKSEKYRKMGAACYAHADELDRFQRMRREQA